MLAIRNIFDGLPASVRAAVITGDGDHFCAGLDLSELRERNAGQGLHHRACGMPRWSGCSTARCQ